MTNFVRYYFPFSLAAEMGVLSLEKWLDEGIILLRIILKGEER